MLRASLITVGLGIVSALVATLGTGGPAIIVTGPGPGETQLVSVSSSTPPVEGNGASRNPSVSADGRYVAFESTATNISGSPTPSWQIYVRDTVTGITRLVSSVGGKPADGQSLWPSISGDGSRIAYTSDAAGLNTGGIAQALVWSRETGASRIVSVSNGEPPSRANAVVNRPVISRDGQSVVFATSATNLTGDDTRGVIQVFCRVLFSNTTRLISVDGTGAAGKGSSSDATSPSISAEGAVIAFRSKARLSLVAPDPGGHSQVYLSIEGQSDLTSASIDAAGTGPADSDVTALSVSPNGKHVAFATFASNVTADSTNGHKQVYVRNLTSGITRLASYAQEGKGGANGDSDDPVLTHYGDQVAFTSSATDLGGGAPNGTPQIFVRDLNLGRIELATTTAAGAAGNGASVTPTLSGTGEMLAYTTSASDLVPGTSGIAQQVLVRNLTQKPSVHRIDGADRFAVAAAVSRETFTPHVGVAYVASGTVFADALSGSAAAGAQQAPVLLVTKDSIPPVIAAELTRLRPARIVVLGGINTIGSAVESALSAFTTKVDRIAGADRFDLSAAISASVFVPPGAGRARIAYIASGAVFPDALSGAAAAGTFGGPVLLVGKETIPATVGAELRRLDPLRIVVLGGADTIAESVVTSLKAIGTTDRIGGADRFAVSAAITADAFGSPETVFVASGAVFPDALAASASAVPNGAPVLLVTRDGVPAVVGDQLKRISPSRIVVLGGPNTVSDAVLNDLRRYLATG